MGAGLRFAMVTTFYPPYNFGGDGIYVRRLAHALARRGHHVEVIHDADAYLSLAKAPPPEPEPEPHGIEVHRLKSQMGPLSSLAVQQLGRPVFQHARLKALLEDRFDVIHYHNVSLVGGPGVWAYGTGLKLHTAHEHWIVCPSHILWRYNREVCDGQKCLSCVLSYGRPPQLWRMGGHLEAQARHVDAFLMLSQSAADNHRAFGFEAPMRLVPSFLPADTGAAPAQTPPAHPRPYFLFVGRLEIIKGLQDIIPHFTKPAAPADLLIAGAGEYEPELRRLAGDSPHIRFLGRQPMTALKGLYRDALAVLTPSRCYEVFPMVVLEAFQEGTPIIARRLGPFPEIVSGTGGGLLFDSADELAQSLDRMASDVPFRARCSSAARSAFETRWSERVAMDAYFAVIRELAEKKGLSGLLARLDRIAA
ncbi:MAG: glycosyltransferase family 4 protein [Alphaproteobacteria bacterium]|nr:glycosyltransferase family 4 protein [Alphaproteobacteria bacterium]